MSIRVKLLVATAIMALLLTIEVVISFLSAVEARKSALETVHAQSIQDMALAITTGFAADRGQTNGIANGAQLSQDVLDKLKGLRETSLSSLAKLLTEADAGGADAVNKAVSGATAIRDRIHQGGQLTKEERGALARDWFAAQTAAIEAIDALAAEMAAHENHSASTQLIRAAEARHQIWEMAEFLGRERGMVNGLLAAKAIPDQKQLMRLAEYRGHVNSAWTAVRPTIEQLGNGVAPLLASATAALTGPLEELRQSVDDAYLAGTAPTVSAQDWFGQTTQVIEQLAALQKGVGAEVAALMDEQHGAVNRQFVWAFALLAGALLATAMTAAIAHFSVASPLKRLTDITRALAGGQLDVPIEATRRQDEMGQLFRSMVDFQSELIDAARLRAEREEFEQKAEADKMQNMHRLADGLETTVGVITASLGTASVQLESAANTLSAGAEETSSQSTAVVRAAEFAQKGTQSAAGAAEELASSVKEIGRQVDASSEAARAAVDLADQTARQVLGLARTAQQIETVVALISDIASRTNLLALNATIEAARAGEAGRGFAVVAQEVKQLAAQTEKATTEISLQATEIQAATKSSSEAIESIATRVRDIGTNAAAIAAAVTEQEAATAEVARSILMAADAAGEVGASISGVADAARETSHTSSEVHDSASSLSGLVAQLKQEVSSVLVGLRNGGTGRG